MSVNYNVLGLIFASMHDSYVSELTLRRTMGSIPFGGRYRLIDFPLSNFVNSGVTEVGVITKSNYGSLLDHLGSGREWDLARKKGGLHLLPPYSQTGNTGGIYKGRLDAMNNVWSFIEHSSAKYVICANADVVKTIDFNKVLAQHKETEADVTVVYQKAAYDSSVNKCATILEFDEDKRLTAALVEPQLSGECNVWLEMLIINKETLNKIVPDAASRGEYSFTRTIMQEKNKELKIVGYEHCGKFMHIDSISNYYKANMALLDTDTRASLFKDNRPVFTKVGDSAPVKYGLESSIKNSFIADGCIIEGTVENSVLFRGVKVGKGAVVKDSILMQGTKVGADCELKGVITDKNAVIGDGNHINGSEASPTYIKKDSNIAPQV
ncbi:MAG: glucose-1-phosphate adenylyltransferase subunit GlgD [Ruminococcus sp.]|nr:glucose-1-phosphate adenylyltransferase subunit GlgD [Ruminococcus sp.]